MNKQTMKSSAAVVLALLIAGCAEPQVASPAEQNPADLARLAIERAEARYLDSQTAGHAWTQTRVSLEQAKQALEQADYPSAEFAADHALALANASLAQAQTEAISWRERFPVLRATSE